MIKIAICDNDVSSCSEIENKIEKIGIERKEIYDITIHFSGEKLLNSLKSNCNYDIIFLSVELSKIDGIKIGKYIREQLNNSKIQIVYMSLSPKYAMKLFKVRPLNFVVKPISKKAIEEAFDIVKKTYIPKFFEYHIGHVIEKILYDDILYFKSDGRKIEIMTLQNKKKFYGKLSDIEKEIPKELDFIAINRSYIINFSKVLKYKYDSMVLVNNEEIEISRNRKKVIKEQIFRSKKVN